MWSAIWWPISLDLNVLNQNSTIFTQENEFQYVVSIWWSFFIGLNVLNGPYTLIHQEYRGRINQAS